MSHFKFSEKCVIKKIGDSFAVWFPPSQSFVLLKGPAYEAFQRIQNGESNEAIVKQIAHQTGFEKPEVQSFLKELGTGFEALMNPENIPYISPEIPDEFNHAKFEHYAVGYYRINCISFRLIFGNQELFQHFDPMLAHLRIDANEDSDFSLDLFFQDGLYLFRIFGVVIEAFLPEHIHFLKGAFFKKIAGLIYSISEEQWMTSFHASAVSDGKSAILFSAKPGGGKSTIAALLQANDYMLLADDFIMLDNDKEHIWYLPLATSVKKGSLKILKSFYPNLEKNQAQTTPNRKQVHYLEPKKLQGIHEYSFPVKKVIFIQYSPETPILIEKISPEEALLSLLEETWVNPQKNNVEQFLNWFSKQECLKISYSDHHQIIQEIHRIFKS